MNGKLQRRLALCFGRGSVSTAIVRGFRRYVTAHELPWLLVDVDPAWIEDRGRDSLGRSGEAYDGAVGFFGTGIHRAWVEELTCPVVQFSTPSIPSEAVRLLGDDGAIGRMAADHLVDQGFRSFACFGRWRGVRGRRFRGFVDGLATRGHGCATLDPDAFIPTGRVPEQERQMAEWLAGLPRPVAVFYHQDRPALRCLELCAAHGLRVPEDVAVLGVDNVVDACEATGPPLSSVELPWQHMGELGARHLHRVLSGGEPGGTLRLPPLRVVERASTARPAPADRLVRRCLRILDREFAKPLTVAGLAARLGIDRSTLHRRLVAATGAGASDHLHRRRIARGRELLIETGCTIGTVARKVGYASCQRFGVIFKQRTGMTPGAYRDRATG